MFFWVFYPQIRTGPTNMLQQVATTSCNSSYGHVFLFRTVCQLKPLNPQGTIGQVLWEESLAAWHLKKGGGETCGGSNKHW